MSELPKNFIDEFLDLKRRVSTLERATRVPAVTGGARGPQSATNYTSYQAASGAYAVPTGGPTVDVEITSNGRALVIASCQFFAYMLGGVGLNYLSGHISVKRTGANTFTPNIATATDGGLWKYTRDNTSPDEQFTSPIIYVSALDGLTPGATTFTWVEGFQSDEPVAVTTASGAQMSARQLLVLPF